MVQYTQTEGYGGISDKYHNLRWGIDLRGHQCQTLCWRIQETSFVGFLHQPRWVSTFHDMNGRQDQGRAPGLDDEDLGSSRVDPVEAVDIFTLFEKRFYRGSASLGR